MSSGKQRRRNGILLFSYKQRVNMIIQFAATSLNVVCKMATRSGYTKKKRNLVHVWFFNFFMHPK